jgi:hypothetical protein
MADSMLLLINSALCVYGLLFLSALIYQQLTAWAGVY